MNKIVLALGAMLPDEMNMVEQEFDLIKLYQSTNPEKKLQEIKNDVVAILSTFKTPVSGHLIKSLPNLEIITHYGAGYDDVDLNALKERFVKLTNTPKIPTNDTADIAVASLLALSRRIVEADMYVRSNLWSANNPFPLGRSLKNKIVGIVGLGDIGRSVAKKCQAFDMEITYWGRSKKHDVDYIYYDDLLKMALDCDFLIVTCAANKDTHNIINKSVLECLGKSGYLINIARGSIVDENSLIEAMVNKKIAGAALDVYVDEPNYPQELKTLDNVVLLPHIGGNTYEAKSEMGRLVFENLQAYFEGRALLTEVMI